MTEYDISSVNKTALLYELWRRQSVAGFYKNAPWLEPSWDAGAASKAVTGYIDYFQGRAIKLDLSKDKVDARLYDRDAGKGAFAEALAAASAK